MLFRCLVWTLAAAAALGAGESAKTGRPSARTLAAPQTLVRSLWVWPSTLTISGTDPDRAGSSSATVTAMFLLAQGSTSRNWTFQIGAPSASFPGCPSLPVSSVKLSACTVTTQTGGATGTCKPGTFPLSAAPQPIASGRQGNGTSVVRLSFTLTFSDSWRYAAQETPPCTLSLTYTVDAP